MIKIIGEPQQSFFDNDISVTEILAKLEGPLLALENLGDKQLSRFDKLLMYFFDKDKYDKMQAAEQARLAEELRREAIQNGGRGAQTIGGIGAGGGIDDDEEGGIMDSAKTAFMTIAGTWLLAKLAKMKKWFKGLKGTIGRLGTALFASKSKIKLTSSSMQKSNFDII